MRSLDGIIPPSPYSKATLIEFPLDEFTMAIRWHRLFFIYHRVFVFVQDWLLNDINCLSFPQKCGKQLNSIDKANPIDDGIIKECRVAINRAMITECGRSTNRINALKYGWISAMCKALYNSKWVMFSNCNFILLTRYIAFGYNTILNKLRKEVDTFQIKKVITDPIPNS